MKDSDGNTPLIIAATEGDVFNIKNFKIKKIKNNCIKIIFVGREKDVELLLEKGANVNSQNHKSLSALHRASEKGNPI
jgi:ankyrin repeat protein